MIRVRLCAEQRHELRARCHERSIDPRTRDRLEMVRLADAGWNIPRIARHLGYHEQTVRKYIKQFLDGGFDRLPDKPRPGPRPKVTQEMLAALERLIDQSDRTWTTPQLAKCWRTSSRFGSTRTISPDCCISAVSVGSAPSARLAISRRTPTSKQPKRQSWRFSKNQARNGEINLAFLDQSGFAPTMPTGYTWARTGERKIVPYEAPEGRRVNVVGDFSPFDPAGPSLLFESRCNGQGKYDSDAHLRFVHKVAGLPAALPEGYGREHPCVIVLDNYSIHHSQLVKDKVPALEAAGVRFFFLPPYSPEMNAIEPLWRQVKYQDLPKRSYKTAQALQSAVDDALTKRVQRFQEIRLCPKSDANLRRCA